jgi:hypothetical protein
MHGICREETGVASDHVEGFPVHLYMGCASKQITNLLKPRMRVGQSAASTCNSPENHLEILGTNIIRTNQTAVTRFMVISGRVRWNRILSDEIF